ncbi:MAG: ribonuclease HI family protein [Planctomycetes bacterium]|nr:ribonuclease HI family protein [Planctomycetota bacterium]
MTNPDSSAANTSGSPPPDPGAGPAAAHLILYVDGACSGNPGPCGSAAILKADDGTTLLEKARAFGPGTNNEAEYQAVILGLELAAELRPRRLTIRSDSELMVRQVAGQYRVKAPNLKPLIQQVRRLLEPFESVEIEAIPRRDNAEADKLARKAVEKARAVDAALPPEARKKPKAKTFKLK